MQREQKWVEKMMMPKMGRAKPAVSTMIMGIEFSAFLVAVSL
jgi:hypothetical protein